MKDDTMIQCEFAQLVRDEDGEYIERLVAFIPNDKRIKAGVMVELIDSETKADAGWWKVEKVYPTPVKKMALKRGWNNNI